MSVFRTPTRSSSEVSSLVSLSNHQTLLPLLFPSSSASAPPYGGCNTPSYKRAADFQVRLFPLAALASRGQGRLEAPPLLEGVSPPFCPASFAASDPRPQLIRLDKTRVSFETLRKRLSLY